MKTQTFSPILDQGAREPTDPIAVVRAFRVGFVATPKPGCGWCWCCCSLLGETSRKLYTHTYRRARTYMRARARARTHARTHARTLYTYMRACRRAGRPIHVDVYTHRHTRNSHPHRTADIYAGGRARAGARKRAHTAACTYVRTYVRTYVCSHARTRAKGATREAHACTITHTLLARRGKCR